MAGVVGNPAERQRAGRLPEEHQGGEDAGLGRRRFPGAQRVDRVEPGGHRAGHRERAREEKPREVTIAPQQGRHPPQVGAQAHRRGGDGGHRLAHHRERHVGESHAHGRAEEADTIRGGCRHPGQRLRHQDAGSEADEAGGEVRQREEAATDRGRDRARDEIHPGRHEETADAGRDQEHGEHQRQRQAGPPRRREERQQGQDQERHPLPHGPLHEEGQLPGQRLGVAGREQRRQEPAERHHGRDGADDDVRRAEPGGERGQDRRLRGERQPDHVQPVVRAEGEDVVAKVLHAARRTTPSAISTARTMRPTSMLGCSRPLAATIAGSSGKWMKPACARRPRRASQWSVPYIVWLQR